MIDGSKRPRYDPNKYKQMRESQSFYDENVDDEDLFQPIKPKQQKNNDKISNSISKKNKTNDKNKSENIEQTDRNIPESLVDEYFVLKKQLHENTSSNDEIILGKNSFAMSTIKDNQDNLTSIKTNWSIPKSFKNLKPNQVMHFLKKNQIFIDGVDIPPPIKSFSQLKIPKFLISILNKNSIYKPISIQSQCFPIIFSGRDLIARSFTGTGKSLLFQLSFLFFALQQENIKPLSQSEGPWFLYVSPSRELATQTFKIMTKMAKQVFSSKMIKIKVCLIIGGVPIKDQVEQIEDGVHIIIATTGRLTHLLTKNLKLDMIQIFCIDEANVMNDSFYGDEIVQLIPKLPKSHQTIILSTVDINTMPHALLKSLINTPIVVQSLQNTLHTIRQEFYFLDQENKMPLLLKILQKTPPPVLIFAFLKEDVDLITEYLLLKGLKAVALHSDKHQSERDEALEKFMTSNDILVATDIASKGLDFKDVKHVINYEIPEEIDLYIHRIGRTGRHGQVGLSTTIVEKGSNIRTLIEIKKNLIDCKQPIPAFFNSINIEDGFT